MRSAATALAAERLRALFPPVGPWTAAALWHGRATTPPARPTSPLRAELASIQDQRLSGLLLRYLRDTGTETDSSNLDSLRQASFSWMSLGIRAVAASDAVLDQLRALGIEPSVSKGAGIARHYPSPECRPYSDVDLLVEPGKFGAAATALENLGWYEEERNRQPWPWFRRVCREGLNLRDDSGGSIDLHHRAPPWMWSDGVLNSRLLGRVEEVEVAGTTLPCLSSADNLMIAALHIVSDRNKPGQSLIVWRDIVELVHAVPVEEAVAVARAAGLAGWLRAVLQALPEPFGTERLVAALPDDPIPHARRLTLLLSPRTASLGVVGSQMLRLPVANGLAFAAGMAVPSRAFLGTKYPDEPHQYRRWWGNSRARISPGPAD